MHMASDFHSWQQQREESSMRRSNAGSVSSKGCTWRYCVYTQNTNNNKECYGGSEDCDWTALGAGWYSGGGGVDMVRRHTKDKETHTHITKNSGRLLGDWVADEEVDFGDDFSGLHFGFCSRQASERDLSIRRSRAPHEAKGSVAKHKQTNSGARANVPASYSRLLVSPLSSLKMTWNMRGLPLMSEQLATELISRFSLPTPPALAMDAKMELAVLRMELATDPLPGAALELSRDSFSCLL
jgi:hypothetical protein